MMCSHPHRECERELGEALVQQVHKHLTLADPEEAEVINFN